MMLVSSDCESLVPYEQSAIEIEATIDNKWAIVAYYQDRRYVMIKHDTLSKAIAELADFIKTKIALNEMDKLPEFYMFTKETSAESLDALFDRIINDAKKYDNDANPI